MQAVLRILLLLLVAPAGAFAHIDPRTGQDYTGFQRNDGKGSCCDWHDCRPAGLPFTTRNGQMIADRAGNIYPFEPDKVVGQPSSDGNWHICGDAHRLKCIIAPAEGRMEWNSDRRRDAWARVIPAIPTAGQPSPAGLAPLPAAREKSIVLPGEKADARRRV